MSSSIFSGKEFQYLTDTEFLLAKKVILEKIRKGFKDCSDTIDKELQTGKYLFNKEQLQVVPKISTGDNYKDLPYIVLDNPRYFKKNAVLSYRVLLWWGNLISFSLHLEGPASFEAINSIIENKAMADNTTYYCVGESPWDYHFEKNNFRLLRDLPSKDIRFHFKENRFLKIAKRANLEDWPLLNTLAIRNLQLFAELTSLVRQF